MAEEKKTKKQQEREKKRLEKLAAERERTEGLKVYEKQYASFGIVCGVDEAGRGPLAGPVVAGAVILPPDCTILYINDSKKLSAKKREELYPVIMEQAVAAWRHRRGLTRLISCRQRMRRCGKLYIIWAYSPIYY